MLKAVDCMQDGAKCPTTWLLAKSLSAIYKLLQDCLVRKSVYLTTAVATLVLLFFWKTHHLESEELAGTARQLWPDMVEYIKFVMSLTLIKKLKDNASSETSSSTYSDPIISFFKKVAGLQNKFLRGFQTDNPMVQFLYDVRGRHQQTFMKIINLNKLVDQNSGGCDLIKFSVCNNDVYLVLKSINLLTTTKHFLETINSK